MILPREESNDELILLLITFGVITAREEGLALRKPRNTFVWSVCLEIVHHLREVGQSFVGSIASLATSLWEVERLS